MNFQRRPEQNALIRRIDRRDFLKVSGLSATGIILGLQVCAPRETKGAAAAFSPNAYLTVNSDGSVMIIAHRSEMGTGIRTGLPLVVADELEADWKRVTVVQAVGDEAIYGNQNTDGSFSVRMFFEPMRRAGATARTMLVDAAAKKWNVTAAECRALNHEVVHEASGRKIGFGELAADAAAMPVPKPETVVLKNKTDWRYIGKSTDIVDIGDIVSGKAKYGLDVSIPDMKFAAVARCPVVGGKVKSYNADKARQVPGVVDVIEIEPSGFPTPFENPKGGIGVIADNTWAAIMGKLALEIEWDFGPNVKYNTDNYFAEMRERVGKKGHTRREEGSVDEAFSKAAKVMESTFITPHLSHAPMEVPNAVAVVKGDKCEVWAPTQHPQWARGSVATALKLKVENVTMNVTLLGGGFGRKSKPDYVVEAAVLSQKSGKPIKVVWTREDDIQNDFFHACSVQHIRVAFDKQKKVTGWNHRSVFPPISGTTSEKEIEPSAGELQLGMVDFPYNIPAIRCEAHEARAMTRIGWLRSVSNIQHAFAIGSMMDEIAAYRKVDPVKNLLELLGPDRLIPLNTLVEGFENYGEPIEKYPSNTKRLRGVIELVADKAGWGKSLPKGHGMGICAHRSFLTYVACVVHVAIEDGKITIPEVHYAVDCGTVVNRNSVMNQFEGGAVFASSAVLGGGITFKDGRAEQSNFDRLIVARMNTAPKEVFVHLAESDELPTGVGEPPVPPFAPALANAVFAATGKRYRELPISLS